MADHLNIDHRKPIWIAISALYEGIEIGTRVGDSTIRRIALAIIESPYSLDESKAINKYEVFPVLWPEFLKEPWFGIDEDWLVEKITARLNKRSNPAHLGIEIGYILFKRTFNKNWKRVEKKYFEIKENLNTYFLVCREAYFSNIFPFQFDQRDKPIYQKLIQLAINYRDSNRHHEFYQYLHEWEYNVKIWTAYFLLEYFPFDNAERILVGGEYESVFNYSFRLIEKKFQEFPNKEQVKNCSYWLEEKRDKTSTVQ